MFVVEYEILAELLINARGVSRIKANPVLYKNFISRSYYVSFMPNVPVLRFRKFLKKISTIDLGRTVGPSDENFI